jgi:medium-chain acyl-[acyl-carrier-protein] hydrolase
VRLFCFPHAGGGASTFREWAGALSPTLEVCAVQLPGRENRLADERYTELGPLIEELAEVLLPLLRQPFALFGHSLGALIGFELGRRLRDMQGIAPLRLFVSGHRAPHLPLRMGPFCPLSDPEFVAAVRALGTTPAEVFDTPELRELVLPILRADFALVEGYSFAAGAPLDCPISVFGGTADQLVTPGELVEWREHTRQRCTMRAFRGDHFFFEAAGASVLQAILHDVTSDLASRERAGNGPAPSASQEAP